jgi:hypothetical protein
MGIHKKDKIYLTSLKVIGAREVETPTSQSFYDAFTSLGKLLAIVFGLLSQHEESGHIECILCPISWPIPLTIIHYNF